MTKQELLDKANDLPLAPGVYLMMDKTGCVIYVGKAKKLKNRVSQYFQENSSHNEKTRRMVSQVDHFDTIFVSTEFEALILENSLIKQHMPRYNILLKDDKGYPFVRLGTEHYPRFTMASKPADDNALYFGPFGGRNETRAAIDAICAAFRLPTCSRKFPRDIGKERPCLNHHMGRCDAFCRGTPDEDEYMRRIGQAEELLNGYDAVVLCCGAKQARDLNVPGRDAKGVHFAVDYLTSVTKSLLDSGFADGKAINAAGKNVLVIGGGDTGNDCQGTALRQGCTDLMALEMMPQPPAERTAANPWPEWPRVLKVDYGQTECIAKFGKDPRVYQTTVKEFLKDEAGNLTGAVISCLKPERDPETGRTSMVPTGKEFTYDCQLAFIAAGFTGCENYTADAFGVELTARGNVADHSFKTNVDKVFVCGDMRRGQSLVVWGLREGRDCAAEVDRCLMGYSNL